MACHGDVWLADAPADDGTMRLPMMGAAEGNGELVADLATERA